jgi:hypothetical protein
MALVSLKGLTFVQAAFSGNNQEIFERISFLPPFDLASLKVSHAFSKPRFDIGVFGNSRIVSVGDRDLNLEGRSFFNFAVPGTSLRQSVNIIEELAARGKAPRLAIISFDNLEIGYYGNAVYPALFPRWRNAAQDVFWTVFNRPGDLILLAHVVLDHVYTEWAALTDTWNANAIWARAAVQAPDIIPPIAKATYQYFRDGSRPLQTTSNESVQLIQRPEPRMILLSPYMAHDLERLAKLNRNETRILIFESHLEAKSASYVDTTPDKTVVAERQQFSRTCKHLALDCYTTLETPLADTGSRWWDCCHPPHDSLGLLISALANRHKLP